MRIIHTFKYGGNRCFRAGELTVGGYFLLLRDTEEGLAAILCEFNAAPPVLTEPEATRFVRILLAAADDTLFARKKSGEPDAAQDFHLQLAFFMRHLHQPLSDILAMPLRIFLDILRDAEIVLGTKEYDPKRHSERIDSGKLKEVFGKKKTIRS